MSSNDKICLTKRVITHDETQKTGKGASIKVEQVFTDSYSIRDRKVRLGCGAKKTPYVTRSISNGTETYAKAKILAMYSFYSF